MRFENTKVFNIEGALRGMRNPKNSWAKSDSHYDEEGNYIIGENDMKLAKALISAGHEHRKFLRQIFVSVDITAPLYWWKECDTYKIGTTANSQSTMHKLTAQPITPDLFEFDCVGLDTETQICDLLESLRQLYVASGNKGVWRELVQLLPSGWLQTRAITMNYENVLSMCEQRKNHKLNEWSGIDDPDKTNFIAWAKSLPYAKEFIFKE